MSGTAVKKGFWSDALFAVTGMAIIAGVIWLLSRCGVTC